MNYSLYLEVNSEGTEPINYKYVYTIKGISDVIENYTFFNITGFTPVKPLEVTTKQEAENKAFVTNITTTRDFIQTSQEMKQNETIAETKTSNKTAEQIVVVEDKLPEKKTISDFFDKNSLLFIVIIFVIIIIIPFIIYNIKKRKKARFS